MRFPLSLCLPVLVLGGALMQGGCTALAVVTHDTTRDLGAVAGERFALDPSHASLVFKVSHLGFSNYVGRFNSFDADLVFNAEDPAASGLEVRIDMASIDTNNETLEAMLCAPSMFDCAAHPVGRFLVREIEPTGEASGRLTGELTLRDVTQPVTLEVTFNGGAPNPLTGAYTLGFSAIGSFKRSAFGLGAWRPAVGDDIFLDIEVEFAAIASD